MGIQTAWRGVIEEYGDLLPIEPGAPRVTLLEGGTPLLYAPHVSERLRADVWLKVEGQNPTGSFKDRGMCVAVSKALAEGTKGVVCASTGNTSASAAAYAARAGLACMVLVPESHVAIGKLGQALMLGAHVIQVRGNFDDALAVARELPTHLPVTIVNSVNPYRIEGQKTAAFEIMDVLGRAPDVHCVPVGNAGNITAHWKGYLEYERLGRTDSVPRLFGFQAEGSAPIVIGHPVEHPDTVATAIRIGNPAGWASATAAAAESGGGILAVSDEEILTAYRLLAREESVFCEAASAASFAGLLRVGVPEGGTAVCVLTGNGLKDPDLALSQLPAPTVVDPDLGAVLDVIDLSSPLASRRGGSL